MNGIRVGLRIGRLTVAAETDRRKNGYIVWRCLCDCGGEILLDTRCLQRGTVRDCGCVTRTSPGQKDLTGQRFGRLVAVEPTSVRGPAGGTVWRCRCDCGRETEAVSTQLLKGDKKSCGCLSHPARKDYIGRRFAGLVVTEYAGKQGGMHRWKCVCDCGNETVVGQTNLQSGKTKSCGCLKASALKESLGLFGGTSVSALETTRDGLRMNNRSGYTGVYRNRRGQWCAQITFRGRTYYLGCYAELQDAVRARKRGEELHDEFLRWYYLEHLGMESMPEPTGPQDGAALDESG